MHTEIGLYVLWCYILDLFQIIFYIKVVSDFRHFGGFLRVLRVSSTNQINRHDLTEVLLKVALDTI